MTYVVKFIQTNPKRMVINNKMYEPYAYGGIIPFFCQELPKEIESIMKESISESERNKLTWFVDNIIEIDRRCKLVIEIFSNKKLVFRKYF